MVEIKKNFVQTYTTGSKLYAKGKLRNAWVGMAGTNSATEIAIHQTGNVGKGANAEMHGKLQVNGNTRTAGWHYTVDDKEAVQSFPHSARVYHTGTTHGHKNAIAVEICINSDGNYKKAIANAAELVKQLMEQENIPIDKVKRHYDYSGKKCPAQIMDNKDGISWTDFKDMLKDDSIKKTNTKPSNKPTSKPKPKKLVEDGAWGKATTKALQKHYGTPVDGIISGQPKNNNTRYLFSASYGSGGSMLIRAMQRDLGTPVDGIVSYKSTMIKALQRKYGTPVDGYISYPSTLIKEMQKRLNNGTF